MLNQIKQRLSSRQHAGQLLAEKLSSLRHEGDHCVVLAIPQGGIPVAHAIAKSLGSLFEIVFSKRIKHPAHSEQSIGAVSMDDVVLHESTQFIPQSYVLHQISLLQRQLREQFREYYGSRSRGDLKNKTVVLVDDVLRDLDELGTCLHTIARQSPSRIVIAAPIMSMKVINYLSDENYEFHYLFMEVNSQSKPYTYFSEVSEEETRDLFNSSQVIHV